MKRDFGCGKLFLISCIIGGAIQMISGTVGGIVTIAGVLFTLWLFCNHVYVLCDGLRFRTMKRFGNVSKRVVNFGRNMDSIAVIFNTYLSFAYAVSIYAIMMLLAFLDFRYSTATESWKEYFITRCVFSIVFLLICFFLINISLKWIRETNPMFRWNTFEFVSTLVGTAICLVIGFNTWNLTILGIVAILAILLFYTAIRYYQQITSQDAKVIFYLSYGIFAGLEEDAEQFLIVLQDGSVFDSRETLFYPLVQATGDILLYTYENSTPRIISHEKVKEISFHGVEIKI